MALGGGVESLFAEARKLGVSVVTANQYLDQYPPSMRAAVLAVGTQAFFRLSSADAGRVAPALGGGKHLRTLLQNLGQRELIVKSGAEPYAHVRVPELPPPSLAPDGLTARANARWSRTRESVEAEIAVRQGVRGLDGWE